MAGRETVRPINIVGRERIKAGKSDCTVLCIVLRVRESGNSNPELPNARAGGSKWVRAQPVREDAKHPTSGCRFRRIPTRVAATHPQDEGQPNTHLENCTGRNENFCKKQSEVRAVEDSSQKQLGWKNTNHYQQPFLNSLRKVVVEELARSSE